MNTTKQTHHQATKSTKPKDLGVLGDPGGSTRPPLPPGWRWVRLGEVCEINPPRPTLDRSDNAPTTFVPMTAVSAETGRIEKPEVRPFAQVRKGYTYFEEGDVLFAKITPCMQNGKHAVARDLIGGFGFGTTEFHVLRPAGEVLAEWVHAFLRQPAVLEAAAENFAGTVGQQRLPEEYLAALPIPLPPLAEQERIVGVLRARLAGVERLRRALEDQLAAIAALPAALLRQAFHGEL